MAELTNADLTAADELQTSTDGDYTVHGPGTFDDLMEAVNKHLDAQFKLGRVQGSDYAAMYTASIQAAMSNAVQFLLGRANSEKIDAEIALINKQMEKIDAEISLLGAKEATEAKQLEVLNAQAEMIGEQAKGFQWSADNKHFKTIVDGQAVNANIEGVGLTGGIFTQSSVDAAEAGARPW